MGGAGEAEGRGMNMLMWVHIAGGSVAILAGTAAAAAPKGGLLHARAGTLFLGSMLLLGVTATLLARGQDEPNPGLGGMLTCYFVLTSWMAARRRNGRTGRFEIAACAAALGGAAAIVAAALAGWATTPAGPGPIFASAAVCLAAGLLDLKVVLAGKLGYTQRVSRHLWRMCVAFFIATGSFFIGQQDVMPEAVRGSALLYALGLAPLALMLFWLVRIRLPRSAASFRRLLRPSEASQQG